MMKRKKDLDKAVGTIAAGIVEGFSPVKKTIDGVINGIKNITDLTIGGKDSKDVVNKIVIEDPTLAKKGKKNDLHVYAHVSEGFEEDLEKLTKAVDRSDFEEDTEQRSQKLMELLSAMSRRLQQMQSLIIKAIEKQTDRIEKYFAKLQEYIGDKIKLMLSSSKGINDKLTSIISQLKTFVAVFMAHMSAFSEELFKVLEKMSIDIVGAIVSGVEAIIDALDKAINKMLKTLVSAISSAIKQAMAQVIYYLKKIWEESKHQSGILANIFSAMQKGTGQAPGSAIPIFNPGTGGGDWTNPTPTPINPGATTINNANRYVQNEYNIVKKDNLFNQPGDLALMGYK